MSEKEARIRGQNLKNLTFCIDAVKDKNYCAKVIVGRALQFTLGRDFDAN
jgi:hypothetical protein